MSVGGPCSALYRGQINVNNNNINLNYSLSNFTISGVYKAKQSYIDNFGWFGYELLDQLENSGNLVYDSYSFHGRPIFAYFNFTAMQNGHPFQELFNQITVDVQKTGMTYEWSYPRMSFGLFVLYDRSSIEYSRMMSLVRQFEQKDQIIQHNIPSDVNYSNLLRYKLQNLYSQSNSIRFVMQIMNMPILIFAYVLGAFATKINAKSRLDEILLLRSKGSSNKMIRNQFLWEGIANGLVSSIFGLLMGTGLFYMFRQLLGKSLFNTDTIDLPLIITPNSIFVTIGFGCLLTLLTTISSIRYVKNLRTNQILEILGQDEFDVVYDEQTLFLKKEDGPIQLPEGSNLKNANSPDNSLKFESIETQKRKNKAIYDSAIDLKERSNPKVSWLLIILSLFPLLSYLIYWLALLPDSPDFILDLYFRIYNVLPILMMFAIVSPVLLTLGILRMIITEKPSRYARLVKWLTTPFLKRRSYLAGLEMVRQKQFKTIIMISGIFIAFLVFVNGTINSVIRYEFLYQNLSVGADIKASINTDSMNITSTEDLEKLDQQLLNYRTATGARLINNVMTLHYSTTDKLQVGSRAYTNIPLYIFNTTEYIEIIQEDDKILPNPRYINNLEESIAKTHENPDKPGIIVSEAYIKYNYYKLGDDVNLNLTYFNNTSGDWESKIIASYIAASITRLPGIANPNQYGYWDYNSFIVLDIGLLNPSRDLLYGTQLIQLIDINPTLEQNTTLLTSHMNNASIGICEYSGLSIYEQNWDTISIEINSGVSGFYGVIYLESLIIGVLIAFGLAIMLLSIQRENHQFNGILLSRGYGKRKLLGFILSEIFVIYAISTVVGIASGLITSVSFIKTITNLENNTVDIDFPVFFNVLEFGYILGAIIILSFVIYLIAYLLEGKKTIVQYLRKF
jgi:ABC-type antimicrobial peptide transport system permease subunit